ncbi:MAG: 3-phosphoshikimate 1-carboxyvinyltransferase [Candidatus Bathyarchaeia archaeon]
MTNLIVRKTENLSGTVEAPPSKAYTHRALIAASLSEGRSSIQKPLFCDDTMATIKGCSLLGAKIRRVKGSLMMDGTPRPVTPKDIIHCGGSASTIRFLTPLCSLADGISVLTGNEGLRRRPMEPLLDALRQLGVQCYSTQGDGYPPVVVFGGGIRGGGASIRGDISSQFVSGLLFGTPKAERDTEIVVTTQLESKPYVTMTLDILQKHGIKIGSSPDYGRFSVPCGQAYTPFNHIIEGDYSSAAFLLAAAAITNSHVKITNLRRDTLQGDRKLIEILQEMGFQVKMGEDYVETLGANQGLKGIEVDLRDMPDLVPVCAALACHAHGETVIRGAGRLRLKESDRIASLSIELRKMGGKIMESEEGFIIQGGRLHGAEIDSHNDHRIAMACAVAALGAEGITTIRRIECVDKSYPDFVKDLLSLGGEVHVG